MKRFSIGLSLGTALAACPAIVLAQSGTPEESDGGSYGIQEIIVTASKRAESVQDSSLALSVISGDDLAAKGVSSAADLSSNVPGLTVSQGGSVVQTYLRGVGNFATDANAESAIAYNINGVYISRPSGIGPIFFDLDRVEVLKGPQGTLYGRNASGGAINLITRRPGQDVSASGSIEFGNFDRIQLTGATGGGVTDTLAVRAAAQYTLHDGYLTDGYNDQDSIATRLTALWEPSGTVSLLMTGEYTHMSGQGEGTVKRSTLTPMADDPWQGPSIGDISQPPTAFIPIGPGQFGTRIADDGDLDATVWAVSANLDIDMGPATLTFIPAYRRVVNDYITYAPGFRYTIGETSSQQSYELRLANQGSVLEWVAGLYYFKEEQTQDLGLQAVPIQLTSSYTELDSESWAAFGDVRVHLSDTFRLLGGLRYSHDSKSQAGQTNTILPAPSISGLGGERSFSDVNYRVGFEYDAGADNMLFATLATGYKAGGFYSAPGPDNSYDPERLTAFTVGSRNQFFGRQLQINLEGFYWKYDDKQERYLGARAGTVSLLTTNAGKATLYGGNIDITWQPTRADTLKLAVEYLHSKYDSFVYTVFAPPPFGAQFGYGQDSTTCALGPIIPVGPGALQDIDCSGKPLVRAPKWTGAASYQHGFDLADGGQIVIGADLSFASSQYLYPDFVSSGWDNGYATVSADISWHSPGGGITATLWGRNLFDEAIYSGGIRYSFSAPVAPQGDPTLFYANIRPPRTYGVTLSARY
ncbi:MAG: TonB-dependent receptor [Sphingomonadaceae bacterium]